MGTFLLSLLLTVQVSRSDNTLSKSVFCRHFDQVQHQQVWFHRRARMPSTRLSSVGVVLLSCVSAENQSGLVSPGFCMFEAVRVRVRVRRDVRVRVRVRSRLTSVFVFAFMFGEHLLCSFACSSSERVRVR